MALLYPIFLLCCVAAVFTACLGSSLDSKIMTIKKSVLFERSEFIDFSYVTRPSRSALGRF
jgi:hypothetical protein